MIVTTAGRTNQEIIEQAYKISKVLKVPFEERRKRSISKLRDERDCNILVVGKERLELFYKESSEPFFFHPNSAMFRAKRWIKGERDPFLEAVNLKEGDSFLDCTLGLASDSTMASLAVGEKGKVVGTEGNRYVAYIVKEGLKSWETSIAELNRAMKRIEVIAEESENYLISCEDKSFDVVYFDPMFHQTVEESAGIESLRPLALHHPVTKKMVKEACRVARKRVVLKDHFRSPLFDALNFDVHKRKTALFHYGVKNLLTIEL
jgi:16S rRNA G966 N2-methylase RsmD